MVTISFQRTWAWNNLGHNHHAFQALLFLSWRSSAKINSEQILPSWSAKCFSILKLQCNLMKSLPQNETSSFCTAVIPGRIPTPGKRLKTALHCLSELWASSENKAVLTLSRQKMRGTHQYCYLCCSSKKAAWRKMRTVGILLFHHGPGYMQSVFVILYYCPWPAWKESLTKLIVEIISVCLTTLGCNQQWYTKCSLKACLPSTSWESNKPSCELQVPLTDTEN